MDKDDSKARGFKHRTNKKKYKSNKTGPIPPAKTKSAAALESNWDRYEQEEPEKRVNSSTDFSLLANAPITHGSYFQFKSDKDIAQEITEPANSSSLFKLDLAALDKSLSTIPFCVRSGIEDCYFTENQHRMMNSLDDNINNYSSYVGRQHKNPNHIFGSKVTDRIPELNPDLHRQADERHEPPHTRDDDLEQWLDDILDD